MKGYIFSALVIVLLSWPVCVFGQTQLTNPKRTVLFTMGPNEVVYYNEYFITQQLNKNQFACIIEDTIRRTLTFVFNGKRIISTVTEYNCWRGFNFKYINVTETNGYVFSYCKKSGNTTAYYINNRGIIDGPYDDISIYTPYEIEDYGIEYDYYYQLANRWYGHIGGKNKMLHKKEKQNENQTYISNYTYKYADGKYYIERLGSRLSNIGYDYIWDLQSNNQNEYSYCYQLDQKHYVNFNGKSFGPYKKVCELRLSEDGSISFMHTVGQDGRMYKYDSRTGKSDLTRFTSFNADYYGLNEFIQGWEFEFFSTNDENSFYSNYEYEYVVIDGRRFAKSPAIIGWYDKAKHAFIWNAIEGSELLLYEYGL